MDVDVWDGVWESCTVVSDYSLRYIEFMQGITQDLAPGAIVLETGCGTGQTLRIFSGVVGATIGLDMSSNAVSLAQKNCDTPVKGDLFHLPFRNGQIDLVYNSGVIEHFKEPMNAVAVMEMIRVLKPDGKLIVIVPNTFCLWYRVWKWVVCHTGTFEFGYEEDYSLFRLKRLFKNLPVVVERFFGLQALPPLATGRKELISLPIRKWLCGIERYLPGQQYYAYAIGVVLRKVENRG